MIQPSRDRDRRRLVVDACVVLKWQRDDEDDVDRALALRDDFLIAGVVTLEAPTLLVYELVNGIRSAARRARLAPEVESEALANLLACGIRLHAPDGERVLSLARRFAISAYDAAYVAVAEALGSELWTADGPLHRAVQGEWPHVRWIGDYAAA